jgi:hypothetical protein
VPLLFHHTTASSPARTPPRRRSLPHRRSCYGRSSDPPLVCRPALLRSRHLRPPGTEDGAPTARRGGPTAARPSSPLLPPLRVEAGAPSSPAPPPLPCFEAEDLQRLPRLRGEGGCGSDPAAGRRHTSLQRRWFLAEEEKGLREGRQGRLRGQPPMLSYSLDSQQEGGRERGEREKRERNGSVPQILTDGANPHLAGILPREPLRSHHSPTKHTVILMLSLFV